MLRSRSHVHSWSNNMIHTAHGVILNLPKRNDQENSTWDKWKQKRYDSSRSTVGKDEGKANQPSFYPTSPLQNARPSANVIFRYQLPVTCVGETGVEFIVAVPEGDPHQFGADCRGCERRCKSNTGVLKSHLFPSKRRSK